MGIWKAVSNVSPITRPLMWCRNMTVVVVMYCICCQLVSSWLEISIKQSKTNNIFIEKTLYFEKSFVMISHISYINCFIWYSFVGSVAIMMQWNRIHIAVSKAQKVTFQHWKIALAFNFIFWLHWYTLCDFFAEQAWCHRYRSTH